MRVPIDPKIKTSEWPTVRRLALIFPLICALGCSAASIRPTTDSGVAGSFSGIATSDLIEALRVAEKDLRSIDALGKVRIATPENRLRASQVVMARAPDAFRIEVLAPFGISYAVATDGETLAALSTQENILFRGPPDEQTIAEVIGIALSPRDMTSLLLGRPPVRAETLASSWTSNRPLGDAPPGADSPLVFLHAADGANTSIVIGFTRMSLRREPKIVPVSFQRIARNGQQLLRATFEDFTEVDKALIPQRIRIHAAATDAVIEYSEVQANKLLPRATFLIPTPPGATEESLRPSPR